MLLHKIEIECELSKEAKPARSYKSQSIGLLYTHNCDSYRCGNSPTVNPLGTCNNKIIAKCSLEHRVRSVSAMGHHKLCK